jgi:hypothetical protein
MRPSVTPALSIDDDFIAEWEPRYDEKDYDQPEYQRLTALAAADLASDGLLSQNCFVAICEWKWGRRSKSRIRDLELARYGEVYGPSLKQAVRPGPDPRRRLELLTRLPGLGPATASTLIHFMAPEEMPIIDTRARDGLASPG